MEQDDVSARGAAGRGRITVRALAAETGLSIATVSRVINAQGQVSEDARRRVQEAIDGLGGRAPATRPRQPKIELPVLVRCPYKLSDYFGALVTAVAEALVATGRRVLLDVGDSRVDAPVLRELPAARETSGAILILPPEPAEDLRFLQTRRYPLVVVDPRTPVPRGVVSIASAHTAGARAVTRHLLDLGHRRIGVISGFEDWLSGSDRLAGHLAALSEAGLLGEPRLLRYGEPAIHTGVRAGGELLDLPERPTAIACFNDKVAVGVYQAAAERGLGIPADLSVTGFDDSEISQATAPMLTTVRQPLDELGRIAVTMLTRLLERQALDALHLELATELVVRGSTGPVPPR
ncbi:LacI family DNA-binding transcriptional regulator [Catenulispora pinisilvae]|uniref:LacI family DNA-binding transcriptional regulator n=1 Tax=Catenulispora pinisilvae TaxID=2705253 RepID=UPI001891E299|nr:LacI family DNA-binding transcriptional regulator [Catenulispora pinisilvae]